MLKGINKSKKNCKRLIDLKFNGYLSGNKSIKSKLSKHFVRGDRESFARVYKKFKGPILSYVMLKLRNHDVAEELVQEVFLKAFRFRESFDPKFELSAWLWTIARNTLSDWLRKNRWSLFAEESLGLCEDLDDFPSQYPDPEVLFIEASDQEMLAQMMNALTDLQKKALHLRVIYRFSYQDIGEKLNLSVPAVKSVLHRARLALTHRVLV